MGLRRYLVSRVLQTSIVFFITMTIIWVIIRLAPGDPVEVMFGMRPGAYGEYMKEDYDHIRHILGLDKPLPVQYADWMFRLLKGNLGYSYIQSSPVAPIVLKSLVNTLKLQAISFVLTLLISIPVGIITAIKQYSKISKVLTGFVIFFWSLPSFWFALITLFVFSYTLRWFPTHGTGAYTGSLFEQLKAMILPIVVLGVTSSGFIARLIRSGMLEVWRQDYILAARSRGLREMVIIYRHAFRNALLPVITVVGIMCGLLFSGSAVIEVVFSYPGIGYLIVNSAYFRDYPLMLGSFVVTVSAILILNMLVDILYGFIDPRIRH